MSAPNPSPYDFTPHDPVRNWIAGRWQRRDGEESLPVMNPRHGREMSTVPLSGPEEVDAAVDAARTAYPKWRALPIRERAAIFYRLRELMHRDLGSLASLVSQENGKTLAEAEGSVLKAIECAEFGCSLPNLAAGQELEVSRGVECRLIHKPLGVVAGVTPFNFPLMVPLWMLPQALIAGNCFVLKPSEQVPLSAQRLAELFAEAGLPAGVFNVVNGAKAVVEALCDHPGISAMAFVGSTPVARKVYARGAAQGKRMLCLGGAKNHLIVVPDADPELTAQNVVDSFTGCAGQRCMAASVLVAVGEVDAIIEDIVARASAIQPGEKLGPIINAKSLQRIDGLIAAAEKEGATLLLDGRQKTPGGEGYWMGPTLIDGLKAGSIALREEIFGPVLSIVRVKTLDEAIALENSSPFGNASSIYTQSGDIARKVMNEVSAGMCGVNIGVPVPREPFGFGGWNDSLFGHGNITGWDGFRFWTRPRKISSKWALQSDQTWMS